MKTSKTYLVFFWFLFQSVRALGAEWYVATTGSDAASGSSGAPFATLNRAMNAVSPGDTVILRGGVYNETLFWSEDYSGNPVTIRAFGGETPTLHSAGGATVFHLSGAKGLDVEGIRFTGGGVLINSDSAELTFTECRFEGISGAGHVISVNGSENVSFVNCDFIGNRRQFVFSVTGSNDGFEVRNSRFIDNFYTSGDWQNTVFLSGLNSASGVLVENNLFEFTQSKQSRPIIDPGKNASAITVEYSDGGSLQNPGIVVRGNTIRNYRFRGTNDGRNSNPSYLKTPEQGGEQCEGIQLIESSALLIEGNQIENISAFGIRGFLLSHSILRGNVFWRCGANGIFLVGDQQTVSGGSPVLISENRVHNSGWQKGGASGISTMFTGPGNLIIRNFVTGQQNGTAGEVGADWYGDGNGILLDVQSAGSIVIGNVVAHNQGAGISANASSDSIILHNTVVGNGRMPHGKDNFGIFVAGEVGPSDRILIANNLMYNNRQGQFWVWKTALDHRVFNNLYAAGPLTTVSGASKPISWYGNRYSVAEWAANPPVPGNGVGSLAGRPVFLGDILGGDPRNDLLYYVPVNGSAGVEAAANREQFATLPALEQAIATFPDAMPLLIGVGLGGEGIARPATGANIGGLEGPTGPFSHSTFEDLELRDRAGAPDSLWSSILNVWLGNPGEGVFGDLSGIEFTEQILSSSTFGWVHYGDSPEQYGSWIWSQRFEWMKFELSGENTFLWVPMMNSWMNVNPNGTFNSFQWGRLTPRGLNRYQSSIFGGLTTGDYGGWVASDRFGWMWANGDGTWFWSQRRNEWLGVTAQGRIWSTSEERFL